MRQLHSHDTRPALRTPGYQKQSQTSSGIEPWVLNAFSLSPSNGYETRGASRISRGASLSPPRGASRSPSRSPSRNLTCAKTAAAPLAVPCFAPLASVASKSDHTSPKQKKRPRMKSTVSPPTSPPRHSPHQSPKVYSVPPPIVPARVCTARANENFRRRMKWTTPTSSSSFNSETSFFN